MPHTQLTKTTKALLTQYGKAWDSNFTKNTKSYWAAIWRSANRKRFLQKMEQNLAVLQRSRDKHAACDFYHLASTIQSDAYKLKNLYPQNAPNIKAKAAKAGRDEILALLDAPFVDGIYGDKDSKVLHIITTSVEIRTDSFVYQMGQYRVCLDFKGIPEQSSTMHIPAHRTRVYNDCHHQHIYTSGGVCRGQAGGPMMKLFSAGLLYEAVAFVFNFLQSPSGSGYADLAYFKPGGSASARPVCGICRYTSRSSPLLHCKYCKIALCGDCIGDKKICLFCGEQLPKRKAVKKPKTAKNTTKRRKPLRTSAEYEAAF